MEKLDIYREQIDKIDTEIIKLFEERMDVVLDVAKYKKENSMPIYQAERENVVLKKVEDKLENKGYLEETTELFKFIMDLSKSLQDKNI